MKTPPVRLAGPRDEEALYDLLLLLEADNSLGIPHDPECVRRHIQLGTRGLGGFHGVIDGGDARLAGSVGLVLSGYWWNDKARYLSQLWFFVRKDQRKGTGCANALRAWARDIHARYEDALGAPVPFDSSVLSRHRLAAKLRYFGQGAEMIGAFFLVKRGRETE